AIDTAVEPLHDEAIRRARFVGLSVPMHTAMRLALVAAARVRRVNPLAHVCFYGLYAPLQRELLLARGGDGRPRADSVLGGEYEDALLARIEAVAAGVPLEPAPPPPLVRLPFAPPSRDELVPLGRY